MPAFIVQLLAGTSLPTAGGILAAAAMLTAFGGFLGSALNARTNLRSADDVRSLGVIEAAQVSQTAALVQANLQLVRQDEKLERQSVQIADLQTTVENLRASLADTIRHHQECEEARVYLQAQIDAARR